MKKTINTLQDALAYQLQGLLYTEEKVKAEFETCSQQVSSSELRDEMSQYVGSVDNKLQKLNRIFNYLMQDPTSRKNEIIARMIDETHHLLGFTSSAQLKDILTVSCIQNINAYKTASYRTAYLLAVELELDTAADLIQQILEWELGTGKRLASLSIHEFNKLNRSVKTK
ncbi:MAG: ferritin-like domain-containing protein [Bacteroidota bacterium]